MSDKMKPVGQLSPYLPVVDKAGNIKHLYYDHNAGHEFVQIYKGMGELNPKGREHGYTSLKELYEQTSNPTVRENGLAYYRKWDLECKKGSAKMEICDGPVPGTKKKRAVAFPDKWLPDEVVARRNGTSSVSLSGWEPPELETEEDKKKREKAEAKAAKAAAARLQKSLDDAKGQKSVSA